MNKIKILYIITKSDVGGAQKYVHDLAGNLDKDRFEAKILYGGRDFRWLSNKVRPWLLFVNDWLAIFEIYKILKKESPDIVHLNSSKAGVLGSLAAQLYRIMNSPDQSRGADNGRLQKLKVIFTAHGWVFNPANHLNPLLRIFYMALHKSSAYLQDEIICVSEYDFQLALQYDIAPKDKLHTIHNGIDPNLKLINKKEAQEEILKKFKVESRKSKVNEIWIGSVGRLVKEKNYETFIESAKEISGTYFFIIGEGPERKRLQITIDKLQLTDRFFIIPPSGEDAKYLKAFDIFVMSSIKEGLPYILLEAMAAELPIVVTEAGGIPEIIKDHSNGMMVSLKNPHQLAQAIAGLIHNPQIADEMKKAAKTAVIENFSLKKMVSKTEAVYKSLKSESL